MRRERRGSRERGIALVTTLMLTLIVLLLGYGLTVSTRGARRTETGFKNQQRAFEAATAGLERAREIVRQAIFSTASTTYTSLLTAAAGADGNLVNSSDIANFAVVAGMPTIDDVPMHTATLGGITYSVYMTNDAAWDGSSNKTDGTGDGKHVFTLTSFAQGENAEGFAAVQGVYRGRLPVPIPSLPGAVTLPGPSIDFSAPNSAQAELHGAAGDPSCFAAIATSTNTAETAAVSAIPTGRRNNYDTCDNDPGTGSLLDASNGAVENFINSNNGPNPYAPAEINVPVLTPPSVSPLAGVVAGCNGNERDMISTACLNSIVAALSTSAAGLGGYVGTAPTAAQLGSPTDPRIAVVTGDLTINGSPSHAGVLVVTGNLELSGGTSYTGVILAIGKGWVRRNGGGGGSICGGILVADTVNTGETDDSWIASGWVGQPHYEHNGGGTSATGTCAKAIEGTFVDASLPFARIGFQQLR